MGAALWFAMPYGEGWFTGEVLERALAVGLVNAVLPDAGATLAHALALAGAIALPLLARAGFRPAAPNPEQALDALRWIYAGLPLVLRGLAIGLLIQFHRKGRI